MINDWTEYLKANGFQKSGRREFVNAAKPIAIWMSEIQRVGTRQGRVPLPIEIHDPFIEAQDEHRLHLFGDLTPEGICLRPVGLPSPCWLDFEQPAAVFEVLRGCLHAVKDYFNHGCTWTGRNGTGGLDTTATATASPLLVARASGCSPPRAGCNLATVQFPGDPSPRPAILCQSRYGMV